MLILFSFTDSGCCVMTHLYEVLQSNFILTLYKMKNVSLGLQMFTAYSMDYLGRRSGKFQKEKIFFFFFMYILEECYIKPKLTQILSEGKYFDYRLQPSVLLKVTFYANFFVRTHKSSRTLHINIHLNDEYMNLTYAYKLSCD